MNDKRSGASERAMALFKEGYSCSQAVIGAFCDETGLDGKITRGMWGG
jgi:hypothetical protein